MEVYVVTLNEKKDKNEYIKKSHPVSQGDIFQIL
jgi:hypothetical protein